MSLLAPTARSTPLEVARQALRACADLDPDLRGNAPVPGPENQAYQECLEAGGVLHNFPGSVEGVEHMHVLQECASALPAPPPVTGPPQLPPAILRLQQCLADHGVEPPYDVAAIGLDRVAAALSACEHLDSDAPSSMGPTWLHAD